MEPAQRLDVVNIDVDTCRPYDQPGEYIEFVSLGEELVEGRSRPHRDPATLSIP